MLENMPDNPRTAIADGAKIKSKLAFARNVICHVNARQPGPEGQTKTSLAGASWVSGLSNSRAKRSDPVRFAWAMFHCTDCCCCAKLLQGISQSVEDNETMAGCTCARIKSVLQEQNKANETKLGSLTVKTQSRENPDTRHGLFVKRAILGQTKFVQEAKQQKKTIDEAKKEINIAKSTELATKKSEALSRLTVTTLKCASLMDGLKSHKPAGDLKLFTSFSVERHQRTCQMARERHLSSWREWRKRLSAFDCKQTRQESQPEDATRMPKEDTPMQ
jgi:hypothetical protein